MPTILALCAGACTGALLRWQLGLWLSTAGSLAWGTLAANALGGYLIGLVLAILQSHPHLDPLWRLVLVTGFLGALTTFSSFSAEVWALLQAQRWGIALLWAMGQVLLSVTLTGLGWWSAHAAGWAR